MRLNFTILFLALLFSSCSVDFFVDKKEDKLIGLWSVEKVTFKEHGAWFRDNISDDYLGDEFEFLPDYRVVYYDADIGTEFVGNWSVVAEKNYDFGDNDSEVEFYIEMHFYDPIYQDAFGFYGFISKLTRKNFKYHVSEPNGELSFQFKKR